MKSSTTIPNNSSNFRFSWEISNSQYLVPNLDSILTQALQNTSQYLSQFRVDAEYTTKLKTTFGTNFHQEIANSIFDKLAQGDFSDITSIEIVSRNDINGANGAFSITTGKIYLAAEFIGQNANNVNAITAVLLEEVAHFVDAQINLTDTAGDEGEKFSALVRGVELSDAQTQQIQTEDDSAVITLNAQTIQIEQATVGANPAFDLIGLTRLRNDSRFAGIDGSGFTVAVLDTGLDASHTLISPNGRIDGSGGTSQASPHVAGAVAFSLGNTDLDGLLNNAANISLGTDKNPFDFKNDSIGADYGQPVGSGDVDLFKVIVPDDGTLYIDIDTPFDTGYVDSYLRVFDADGNELFVEDTLIVSDDDLSFNADESTEFTDSLYPGLVFEEPTDRTYYHGHTTDSFIAGLVSKGDVYYIGVSDYANRNYNTQNLDNRSTAGTGGLYNLTVQFINNDRNGRYKKSDFNKDGKTDILLNNPNQGWNTAWIMDGTNYAGYASVFGSAGYQPVATADFNKDGKTDLVVNNPTNNFNSVWFMDGGNYVSGAGLPTAAGWQIKGAADFNGDGNTDILLNNTSTSWNTVWFLGGANGASYTGFGNLPVANGWNITGVADFNGDGNSDILLNNPSQGWNSVWFLNGTTYSGFANLPSAQGWQSLGTGDFNGDGKPDIILNNLNSNWNTVWLMNGTNYAGFANLPTAPAGWQIAGMA